jgi:hypothetical protein
LIYFGARYYDPDTARFINQDSYLGESSTPPSLHRYLYAYANPVYYIDPDGKESLPAMLEGVKERGFEQGGVIGVSKFWAADMAQSTLSTIDFMIPGSPMENYNENLDLGKSSGSAAIATAETKANELPAYMAERASEGVLVGGATLGCNLWKPCKGAVELSKKVGAVVGDKFADAKAATDAWLTKEKTPLSGNNTTGYSIGAQADAEAGAPYNHPVKQADPITNPSQLLDSPKWATPEMEGMPIRPGVTRDGQIFEQAIDSSIQIDKVTGNVNPGGFFTDADTIVNKRFMRTDLAVTRKMKKDATHVAKYRAPEGIRIQESTVGPQVDIDGTILKGGKPQLEILNYEDRSLLELIDLRELKQ